MQNKKLKRKEKEPLKERKKRGKKEREMRRKKEKQSFIVRVSHGDEKKRRRAIRRLTS